MIFPLSNKFNRLATVLLLAAASIPGKGIAQRFNHGGGGGSAPRSAPAPRPAPAARPAPVSRPEPAARPAAPENRPAAPQASRPAESINGGNRNFGNHDFNRTTVNVHETVNPRPMAGGRPAVNVHDHVTVYHTGGYRGVHPYYYHPYRPVYWGPRWHPLGFFLAALTADAIYFSLNNQRYYYDDGCYYVPSDNGYSVVPAPIGAIVSSLPEGFETTMVGNDYYYYFGGAFYINNGQGYQVVAGPEGAVITQLPVGAVEQNINGETLLVYNNTYYSPISQDGQDAYEVVTP